MTLVGHIIEWLGLAMVVVGLAGCGWVLCRAARRKTRTVADWMAEHLEDTTASTGRHKWR